MYCSKCGSIVGENEKFCQNCGESTEGNLSLDKPIIEGEKGRKSLDVKQINIKPINKKYLIIGSISVIVLVLLIFIISSVSSVITPEKYFVSDETLYKGYNNYATLNAENCFDARTFLADMAGGEDKLVTIVNESLSHQIANRYGEALTSALYDGIDIDDIIDEFYDECFSFKADKTEDIKNGDKITVTVNIDNNYLKNYKFKKKIKKAASFSKTYTVAGLEDAIILDPFEYIDSVIYDVIDEKAYIVYKETYLKKTETYQAAAYEDRYLQIKDKNGEIITELSYYSDTGSFASTQKISISLGGDMSVDRYEDKGFLFSSVQKDITPIKIDYLKDASLIKSDDYSKIKELSYERIKDYSPVFKGAYFCTDSDTATNKMIMIYSYKDDDVTRYAKVNIENIKASSDGKIFFENISISFNSWWGDAGYESSKEIINDVKENWSSLVKVTE